MSLLTREPVRAAFVTTVTAVLALLVALDVIDDAASAGIGGAVLALVGLVTELTRARVVPLVKVSALVEGGTVTSGPAGTVVISPDETVRPVDLGAGELKLIGRVLVALLVFYALLVLI